MWYHRCQTERITSLKLQTILLLIQNMVGQLWCKHSLLNHAQLVDDNDLLALFFRTIFQSLCPEVVLVHGVMPSQVQDLAFAYAEFHEVLVCPFLQTGGVPLKGNPTTPCNLLASIKLLKICFDFICLKTYYRRHHLQRWVRHRDVHLSEVSGPVIKSGLNSSYTSSECQVCVARSLLGLIWCTHMSKESLTWCRRNFLLEQLLIFLTNKASGIYFQRPFSTFWCCYIKVIHGINLLLLHKNLSISQIEIFLP